MYSIYDYAYNGLLYLNNIMRPRHKRLSQLMIYSTTACQSRCKHCNIWQKKVEHLSLDDIQRIMQSQCVTKRTTVGLEGGEFILHPQAAEIMAWFHAHHPNYTLLSNCLAPHRVIDAVRRYHPRHLYVSLDGGRDTYQRMRGRDGYDRVIEVVEALRDEVPLSLMFCLSPWNTFDDMAYVIDVAKHYGVDVRIGIYRLSQMEELSFGHKPSATAFGIPMEKLRAHHETKEVLCQRNNFTPILLNNQIYSQGYFNEMEAFVNAVEGSHHTIVTDIKTIRETYQLMNEIIGVGSPQPSATGR